MSETNDPTQGEDYNHPTEAAGAPEDVQPSESQPSRRIKLSRCLITGPLDENTPTVVLKEISDSIGVENILREETRPQDSAKSADRCLLILRYSIGSIKEHELLNELCNLANEVDLTEEHYVDIARFVNKDCIWGSDTLVEALNFLKRYFDESPTGELFPSGDFEYGLQTPSSPKRYNACVLYKLCRMKKFPIDCTTTLETMASLVYISCNDMTLAKALLHSCIYNISDRSNLIRCFLYMQKMATEELALSTELPPHPSFSIQSGYEYHYDRVVTAHENLKRKRYLLERIQPLTIEEAIVLAAILHKTDVSSLANPVLEYNVLSQNPTDYVPLDEETRELVRGDPLYLRLDTNFNPILPADLYEEKDLKLLALSEGFTATDIENEPAYTLLQTARLSDTFYVGHHKSIVNRETVIFLTDVSLIPPQLLVCYGNKTERLIACRFSELEAMFLQAKSFMNPFKTPTELFTQLAIRKLKKICQFVRGIDNAESSQEKKKLYMAITEVELLNSATRLREYSLFTMFCEASDAIKIKIQEIILLLFALSMSMRGWLGVGPYPIDDAPVTNQVEVDMRVTDAIAAFEYACGELGDLGNQILDLPLLRYRSGEFMPFIAGADNQSIRERINVVKEGENRQPADACIRIGSNYLATSAYRYMEMIKLIPPFDIDRLRYIS